MTTEFEPALLDHIPLDQNNEGFVAKAPAEVLEKERAKLAEAEQALAKMVEQRQRIATL